jgi:sulfide dehydrogenase cytochrome subunit
MRSVAMLLSIAVGSAIVSPAWAADGSVLALSCAACHGTSGKSPGSIPAINGKTAAYVETALTEFKTDRRAGTVMNRLAKGYTDDEIKALAAYFAEMK